MLAALPIHTKKDTNITLVHIKVKAYKNIEVLVFEEKQYKV